MVRGSRGARRRYGRGGLGMPIHIDKLNAILEEKNDQGLIASFAEIQRKVEEIEAFYRREAYALIKPHHMRHALSRILWDDFLAAQRVILSKKDRADLEEGDTRLLAFLDQHAQSVATLEARIQESEIQERIATELLAYAWGSYGGREDDSTIDLMIERFIPDGDSSWRALSQTSLDLEDIQRILQRLENLPAMADAFHNGWGRVSSVALVHGSLPHMIMPWSGDYSAWPEQRFLWDSNDSWFRLTFHENPAGGTDKQRAAAWELASNLNQWVGHVGVAIALIYQRNKSYGGRIVVNTNRILKALGKGGSKQGYRARERPLVNDAMYTLSQLVVQDLRYMHRASRRHKPEPRNAPTRHWLTYDILDRSGDDITYDVWLGEPLLQMVADFPGQIAHILEGSIGPDGRNPHRATLSLIIPIKARSHRKHFTEHGVKVRDILTMAGIDVETIPATSRTRWRKDTLTKLLDSLDCLEWKWKAPPPAKWTQWLDARVMLYVKREANGTEAIGSEKEESEDEAKIASGWLS